jgi:serine/threonine-protein kinase
MSAPKDIVPRHIGRYAVEKLIGEGGMARVYLGHAQSASGFTRPVALKLLQPHLCGDPTFERMLISEASWGGKLCHDGLVAAYELGLHEGSYFVCMEYVEGLTLRDLLASGPLPGEAAIYFASRLALVLDYVHLYAEKGQPAGLVHRDIKPSNVIVSRTGQVKLLDFGIAKATTHASSTQGNLLKGTYAYMSPEQIDGGAIGAASDIFSLGSLLYELLTHRRAFDGESVHETMRRVRESEVLWPEDLRNEHKEILGRCLERDPGNRWPNAAAFFRALQPWLGDFSPLSIAEIWPSR